MSKDSSAHILDDAWVLQVTEAKGFGKGMSKAQKLALAPAVVNAIQRSATRKANRIDAHAPIADPLTAHVVGVTTVGEKLKDFAKDAGITLSPGVSAMVICADCGAEVARHSATQKMCSPCAKAKQKARAKAWNSTPKVKAQKKAYRSKPKAKAQNKAYRSTPERKARQMAYQKAYQKAYRAANKKKARVDTKEAMANREGIKK